MDFNLGFEAPYNIELDGQDGDEPYQFAVVSSPASPCGCCLAPHHGRRLYDTLLLRAADRGLPADTLIETVQPD